MAQSDSVENTHGGSLHVADSPEGSRSSHFSVEDLLPLDDCLHALPREIPSLTRSSLHRLYQRHGISQLPKAGGQKRPKKPFKRYPMGYLHIESPGEGKDYLFVAVDRASKFVHAQLYRKMTRQIAADFLEDTLQALPYRAHTVLTNNGVQFAKKAGTEAYKPHIPSARIFVVVDDCLSSLISMSLLTNQLL